MKRENAKRKGLNRLLVLVLSMAVLLSFSFVSMAFAEENSGSSSGTSVYENQSDIQENNSTLEPLPKGWSNIANIQGREYGYYLQLNN